MKPAVNIITLAVKNLESSLRFYRELMNLPEERIQRGEDHVAFELQLGLTLVLFPREELARTYKQAPTQSSVEVFLSHWVESRDEVDTILKHAVSVGATLPAPAAKHPWGYSGSFKDPDGHIWEIVWIAN